MQRVNVSGPQILLLGLSLTLATPAWPGEPEVAAAWRAGDFRTVARELLPMVQAGDKWAAGQLGRLYFEGAGVPRDLERARKLFLQGEGSTQLSDVMLAEMLMKGQGGEADSVKAGAVLKRWVDLPSALTSTQLVYAEWIAWYSPLESRPDGVRFVAIDYAKRAAAAGDKGSYHLLGQFYASEATSPSPRNRPAGESDALLREALSWHKRAGIEAGDSGSMDEYARLCIVDKTPEATATVARFAQAQSFSSMGEYAYRLQRGIGTRKDVDAAVKWARAASARVDPQSLYVLGVAYRRGLGEQIDAAKSIDLLTRAAAKRHSMAHGELAGIYMEGKLVPADLVLAREWLAKGFDRASTVGDRMMYAGALQEFDRIKAQAEIESRQAAVPSGSADPVAVAFVALMALAIATNRQTTSGSSGSLEISKQSDEWNKKIQDDQDTMFKVVIFGL